MKKQILFLAAIAGFQLASAQQGYYLVPGNGTGNPGSLNNDVEYPNGGGLSAGWSVIVTGSASTASWSANQNIPFSFKFNDVAYSSYKVSTSGVLTFDLAAATAPDIVNADLPVKGDFPEKSVMIWGLEVGSGDFIVTKTFGTAPHRQHWIMFNSAKEVGLKDGWVYMSIVLEEGSNAIYMVDQRSQCITGSSNCTDKTTLSLGIQIDSTSAFKVPGTPNFASVTQNSPDATDNRYFEFRPGTQPAADVALISVNMNDFLISADAPYTVKVNAKNNGSDAINSLKLRYFWSASDSVEGTISGLSLASGQTASVSHPITWNPGVGQYTLTVKVLEVNGSTDGYSMDNMVSKSLSIVDKIYPRKILHEVFTSSTCGPCAPGNANFQSIVANKDQHSTIKYQMNYPGNGDPYYTTENGTRHSFYGINSIPRMEVDGGWDGNANSYTAQLYDQFAAKPAFVEITGSAAYTWKNTITANITLTPSANFNSANLKLFGVIIEKATYNNVATNGETEFYNVCRKVMPSTSGLALTGGLTKGTDVTKSLSYSFNGPYTLPANGKSPINLSTQNSIEDWTNLAVVVFVQDVTTKEVFQSETFDVVASGLEELESGISVYPVPASETMVVNAKDAFMGYTATVSVKNTMGQAVHTGMAVNGQYQLDVKNLANGIYYISIQNGDKVLSRKFVVQH